MKFNMNTTWEQAITLVRGNFQILAIIGGFFLLVPSVLMYVALPEMGNIVALADDEEAMLAMMEGMVGPIMAYTIPAFLFQMVGYFAMIALMSPERPTVGEAIVTGLKALPTLIGAFFLFILGYMLASLALALIAGILVSALGETIGAILAFVVIIFQFVAVFYVCCRLCLTMPVIVREKQLNPIKVFIRSWKITKDSSRQIVGFFLLLLLAYMVISMLIMGVTGLIVSVLGMGTSGLITGIISGVISAGVTMVICGILVSLYQQLSGNNADQLSEAFK